MKKMSTAAAKQANNFCRAETDDGVESGKSIELVLRAGRSGRRAVGTEAEHNSDIGKEGDPHLRTLLVQGAQHILGPFGVDSDLRRGV